MKKKMVVVAMMLGAGAMLAQGSATMRSAKGSATLMMASDGAGMTHVSSSQGAEEPPQQPMKDDLFAGTEIFEKNATEVTDINMDPNSLHMVTGKDGSKARRMLLSTVRTYEYDQPGMYNLADVERFRAKLNTGGWYCSVHTKNLKTGESTDICSKSRDDGYSETAIVTVEKKELTFIHKIERKGDGGHSAVVFDVPPMMGWNTGEMAELRAQMAAMRAEIMANGPQIRSMVVVPPMPPLPPLPPMSDKQIEGLKKLPSTTLKLRKFAGSPSADIMMNDEDAKAPKAPAAPAPSAPAVQP